jgi:hypothetical protein
MIRKNGFIRVRNIYIKDIGYDSFEKIKKLSLLPKIISIIILSLILLLFLAIVISISGFFIWIPLVIGLISDWKLGVLTFIGCSMPISFLWSFLLSKHRRKIKNSEEAVIREYIFLSTLMQLGIIVYFSKNMSIDSSMQFIYHNVPIFTNTITLLYPIFLYGILISNLYLYFHFIRTKFKKIPEWIIKRTDVYLIFIVSSFIGLLVISENKLSFVDETNIESFLRTLDIIKMFITAIMIPLVFNKLRGSSNENNKEI